MNVIKSNFDVISMRDNGRNIQAKRADGLDIFLDKSNDSLSQWLNEMRLCASRKTVFFAVGIARGLQIARTYAAQYGTAEELEEIENEIVCLVSKKVLEFEIDEQRRTK